MRKVYLLCVLLGLFTYAQAIHDNLIINYRVNMKVNDITQQNPAVTSPLYYSLSDMDGNMLIKRQLINNGKASITWSSSYDDIHHYKGVFQNKRFILRIYTKTAFHDKFGGTPSLVPTIIPLYIDQTVDDIHDEIIPDSKSYISNVKLHGSMGIMASVVSIPGIELSMTDTPSSVWSQLTSVKDIGYCDQCTFGDDKFIGSHSFISIAHSGLYGYANDLNTKININISFPSQFNSFNSNKKKKQPLQHSIGYKFAN